MGHPTIGEAKSMAVVVAVLLLILPCAWLPALAQAPAPGNDAAATPQASPAAKKVEERNLSPEEKMNRRFPQPVRVGDLIGLPVLDDQDSTIGYIREVVRTPAGKIQLVVPYGHWFGWVRADGPFDWNRRLVGVPIETVAILGRQVDALDMSREEFDKAPTFEAAHNTVLGADETIKIALGRR
jgi:hypothetical protein